jgi:hypothetical protein
MQASQARTIFLISLLLGLAVVRSQPTKDFFKNAFSNASGALSGAATAKSPAVTLDWHLFLYWGVGAILLIALSETAPNLVTMFLILILIEELLVHWSEYAPLLKLPTK